MDQMIYLDEDGEWVLNLGPIDPQQIVGETLIIGGEDDGTNNQEQAVPR